MKMRFHVNNADGGLLETTSWQDEPSREVAPLTVEKLRQLYGNDARISIERQGVPEPEPLSLFRYDIFVESGRVAVVDEEGTKLRSIKNHTLQSRPFQEVEREKVLSAIRGQFPDAVVTSVRVR